MNANDIANRIAEVAVKCAKGHRAQGWEGGGADYDLGAYLWDLEALTEALSPLGRKPYSDDLLALEVGIRAALGATA